MQDGRTIEPLISIYGLEVLPDDGHGDELFAGELSVTKAPSLKHQEVTGNFATILPGYIGQNPGAQIWGTPGVIFEEYTSAIPDLFLLSKIGFRNSLRVFTLLARRIWRLKSCRREQKTSAAISLSEARLTQNSAPGNIGWSNRSPK